jgi:predicted site-specific integrase-resolvase
MNKTYKIGEFAKLTGYSVNSLQRLDREGKFKAKRTVTDKRYYTEEDLELFLTGQITQKGRVSVGYCRVSSISQKSDLKHQEEYVYSYTLAKGIILDELYSDVGSGLNYKRKKWNILLQRVMNQEIDKIYITYKDRFVRFGFEWFEQLCKDNGTEIIILNQKQTSLEEELTEDLLSILHVFSARSYWLRKYKTNIEKEFKGKEKDG